MRIITGNDVSHGLQPGQWPVGPLWLPGTQSMCISSNHTNLDQNVTQLDLLSDCCTDITLRELRYNNPAPGWRYWLELVFLHLHVTNIQLVFLDWAGMGGLRTPREILMIFQVRLRPELSCQLTCLLTIVTVLTIVS